MDELTRNREEKVNAVSRCQQALDAGHYGLAEKIQDEINILDKAYYEKGKERERADAAEGNKLFSM